MSFVERLVVRPVFWVILLACLFSYPIIHAVRAKLPPKLPVLGAFPEFKLASEHDQPLDSVGSRGVALLVNFFDDTCEADCKAAFANLQKIQHRGRNLGPALHEISFSTGSQTTAELLAMSHELRASPRMWSFANGAPAGFEAALTHAAQGNALVGLTEGRVLVLVDGQMRIRKVYDLAQEGVVDDVLYDLGLFFNR